MFKKYAINLYHTYVNNFSIRREKNHRAKLPNNYRSTPQICFGMSKILCFVLSEILPIHPRELRETKTGY